MTLPIEKEITHAIFCQQIQGMNLAELKAELIRIHLLYLEEKSDWIKNFKTHQN